MQDHTLRVGEELVIQGHVRMTILAVDQDEVLLGITAEPKDGRRPSLAALCDTPVILQKETIND